MRLSAPAKINLYLRVGRRRADGFHPLLSWMCTVGLFDRLKLECADAQGIALTHDLPGLPNDERNLIVRVAFSFGTALGSGEVSGSAPVDSVGRAISRRCGSAGKRPGQATAMNRAGQVGGIRATLEKRIPVGAGLGGGSSDAARTLLGLNRLWRADWPADHLSGFAAQFGSDLPFFFHGPSSVCSGRGEIVKPVASPSARWAVLVLPGYALATAEVYRRFDELELGQDNQIVREPDWTVWATSGSCALLPRLVNDLEKAAFSLRPELGAMRVAAQELLARPVRMSGSGSTLFTLFDAREEADAAASKIVERLGARAMAVELSPDFFDDANGNFTSQ